MRPYVQTSPLKLPWRSLSLIRFEMAFSAAHGAEVNCVVNNVRLNLDSTSKCFCWSHGTFPSKPWLIQCHTQTQKDGQETWRLVTHNTHGRLALTLELAAVFQASSCRLFPCDLFNSQVYLRSYRNRRGQNKALLTYNLPYYFWRRQSVRCYVFVPQWGTI